MGIRSVLCLFLLPALAAAADLETGIEAYKQGDFDLAITCFTTHLQQNPKDGAGYVHRAYAYCWKKEYDKAIKDCTEAIRLDPTNAGAFRSRGHAYEWTDRTKAIADYTEAIRLDPKNVDAYLARGILNSQRFDHDFKVVLGSIHDALPGNVTQSPGRTNLDGAIRDFTEGIRLKPNQSVLEELYQQRGLAYQSGFDLDSAASDFTALIRLRPDPSSYQMRANAYFLNSMFEKAIKDYTEAIRLSPKDAPSYLLRGQVYESKEEYDKALRDYKHAVRLDPTAANFVAVAQLLAICPDSCVRDGKKAVRLARKACELSQWKQVEYLELLAAAYAERGSFKKAIKWQKAFIKRATDKGDVEEAKAVLRVYKDGKPFPQE